MANRLAELQRGRESRPAAKAEDDYVPKPGHSGGDGGGGGKPPAGGATAVVIEGDPLEVCFKMVAEIQAGNRDLQAKTAELRTKGAEVLRSIDPKEDNATVEMQKIMDEATHISKRVKAHLDLMQAQSKKLDQEAHAATVKIHENQHAHLSRTFLQNMQEYKAVVSENEAAIKQQTARRIKLKYTDDRGCSISDERAQEMAQEMLDLGQEDAILDQARGKLAEILETREDLKKMERSMKELHQIFNDLAVLINEQTELMDQILTNVQTSVAYVESGREKLAAAKTYGKKARKKMMCFLLPLGVIFFFVLAVVLGATV
jgi:t-SNARE complex subunit (syntaxin)